MLIYLFSSDLELPYDKLIDFCRKNHIRKLSIFGSALNGRDTPESDIDLIVEFQDGTTELFDWKCVKQLRCESSRKGHEP